MNVESHTKINLGLKVLNQRSDNFYNIETFFVEIDFGDKLEIKKINNGCKISSNVNWVPLDSSNLCYKAYEQISRFCKKDRGVSSQLEKSVAPGSG